MTTLIQDKRYSKEFKFRKYHNFNINYGTINKFNVKSIYININSWCKLNNDIKKNEDIDYGVIIRKLNKNIRQSLSNSIYNKNFSREKIIVCLNIRDNTLSKSKKTYCNLDINLYNKENCIIKLDELTKKEISKLIKETIEILKNNQYFEFFYKNDKI